MAGLEGSRTSKSIKNAKWSILLQVVTILTKFITTTVFVKILGIDYNGLNGLFNEVIAMLSLAEMGVGSAIVYNLYKPLAEHDTAAVQRLMGLFKTAYRGIAASILVLGLILTGFIQYIVTDTNFDTSYIRLVFVIFVVQSAASYLFAYKRSLLNADQQNHVVSVVTLVFNLLLVVLNVAVLLLTHNYIAYLLVGFCITMGINIVTSVIADKKYPYIKQKAKALPEEKKGVISNIKHIFIGTLSGKVTTSTDNILISVLVSTYQIGIYSNYALIMNAVKSIFSKITESISGGFGNLVATESPERVDKVFKRASFLYQSLGFGLSMVLFGVLTPFVKLWIGTDYVITDAVLYISVFNVFLFIAREPLWKIIQTTGFFAQDKNISIIGTIINLVLSIGLGKLWGMAGIFLGTSSTLLIQIVLKVILLYKYKLKISPWPCMRRWLFLSLLTAAGMLLIGVICAQISLPVAILDILLKGVISAILGAGIMILLYRKTDEFHYCIDMAKHVLIKKR